MIPGGWELLVIIGVLILLFGAKRLPEMARSIGQSARVFKGEMKGMKDDEKPAQEPPAQAPQPQALPPAQADGANGSTPQSPPAQPGRSEHSS